MATIVFEFFPKNLKFYILSYVILNFIIHRLDDNLQVFMKISPLLFQLHSNCIYMPIIFSEFFKNIQFYKLLWYPHFYHTYIR